VETLFCEKKIAIGRVDNNETFILKKNYSCGTYSIYKRKQLISIERISLKEHTLDIPCIAGGGKVKLIS
jgi:hypothetical protein